MKTFLFVFLLLICSFRLFSQSNWTWKYPYPQGNELNSVKFTDINTGYSFGMKGTILKTTNGGINWGLQISDVRFDLFNSYFINSEKGFVIGDKGIVLSTANGGLNWDLTVLNSNIKFYSIDFTDSLTGWITGFNDILQQSVLFKTYDSGNNWILNFTFPGNYIISRINFVNDNDGFAGGQGYLYGTSNSGLNWNNVTTFYSWEDFLFKDSLSGIFFNNYSSGSLPHVSINKTSNGGYNFFQYIEIPNTNLNFIYSYDSLISYITGTNGKILKTTNYGNTWDSLISNTFYNLNSIDFSGRSNGWSVGKGGCIINTENEGISWFHQDKGKNIDFITGQFLNPNIAFVSGQQGVLKTTNAGEEWFSVWDSICGDNKYTLVYFSNENDGWLCFTNGYKIYKTSDGGSSWTIQGQFGGYDFYPKAMCFLDENVGFLTGQVRYYIPPGILQIGGFLLKTLNGGQSWTIYTLPSNSGGMYDIKFLNSSTGFIVGGNSTIVSTTNGGNSWFNAVSLFDNILYKKICFINENTGWLLGSVQGNFRICKSTNSGFSWSNITGEVFQGINSFQFLDENIAWMCGESGSVYASSNGGANWIKQFIPTNNSLHLINFINSSTGIAAGNYSTILKTTSGIIPVSVDIKNEISEKGFLLYQNFPNPFNPVTIISYSIPSAQTVKLKIYDILGKEVSRLVNEKQNAGTYRVDFDGGNLSSGIYFYILETEKFSDTKRMILLK